MTDPQENEPPPPPVAPADEVTVAKALKRMLQLRPRMNPEARAVLDEFVQPPRRRDGNAEK